MRAYDVLWNRYSITLDQALYEIPYADLMEMVVIGFAGIAREEIAAMRAAAFGAYYTMLAQGAGGKGEKEFASFTQFLRANGLTEEQRRPQKEIDEIRDKVVQWSHDMVDRALSQPGVMFGKPAVPNLGGNRNHSGPRQPVPNGVSAKSHSDHSGRK